LPLVIAFKTGGLRDTVSDWDFSKKTGNGFTFQEYKLGDFLQAIEKGLDIFRNETNYNLLRKSSFESVVDVSDVARAWDKEFHRLFGKVIYT
jgi:glycogen synthase